MAKKFCKWKQNKSTRQCAGRSRILNAAITSLVFFRLGSMRQRQPQFSMKSTIHEIIRDRFGSVSVQIIGGAENPALACDDCDQMKFPIFHS
jgi:hypothetical protein